MGCACSGQHEVLDDFNHQYYLDKPLGKGSFGQVWSARSFERPEEERAVKILSLTSGHREATVHEAQEEHRLWRKVHRNRFCVGLFEAFADASMFYIVMEKCNATLADRMACVRQLSAVDLAQLFREMLQAIAYLHRCWIVHRDIKPENYLFTSGALKRPKLGDFGLAAEVPKARMSKLKGCFGTAPYMSPEMAGSCGHDRSTDVWSFGATAYHVLYGAPPYIPNKLTPKAVKLAIVLDYPRPSYERVAGGRQLSAVVNDFLQRLLERNSRLRCAAKPAIKLSFLTDAASLPADCCAFGAAAEATHAPLLSDPSHGPELARNSWDRSQSETSLFDVIHCSHPGSFASDSLKSLGCSEVARLKVELTMSTRSTLGASPSGDFLTSVLL